MPDLWPGPGQRGRGRDEFATIALVLVGGNQPRQPSGLAAAVSSTLKRSGPSSCRVTAWSPHGAAAERLVPVSGPPRSGSPFAADARHSRSRSPHRPCQSVCRPHLAPHQRPVTRSATRQLCGTCCPVVPHSSECPPPTTIGWIMAGPGAIHGPAMIRGRPSHLGGVTAGE